jgi:hypothetical protein
VRVGIDHARVVEVEDVARTKDLRHLAPLQAQECRLTQSALNRPSKPMLHTRLPASN